MIQGKHVYIRQLELGDEEVLHKWWNNPLLMQHFSDVYGTLISKEGIRRMIIKDIENGSSHPKSKQFLIIRNDDQLPIGEISYSDYDARNQKCKFGVCIGELNEQGKGYGYDALYHFIDFLFKYLNVNKVELKTMNDNKRSKNLYKKLGFKPIGIIRQGYFDSRIGDFQDVIYMDLLKIEWLNIQK